MHGGRGRASTPSEYDSSPTPATGPSWPRGSLRTSPPRGARGRHPSALPVPAATQSINAAAAQTAAGATRRRSAERRAMPRAGRAVRAGAAGPARHGAGLGATSPVALRGAGQRLPFEERTGHRSASSSKPGTSRARREAPAGCARGSGGGRGRGGQGPSSPAPLDRGRRRLPLPAGRTKDARGAREGSPGSPGMELANSWGSPQNPKTLEYGGGARKIPPGRAWQSCPTPQRQSCNPAI